MKPNFEEMSKAELKAYVLAHREDDEAIRVLFSRRTPNEEATWYPAPLTEETIRITQEAIRQRVEKQNQKYKEKQKEEELQKEREIEERLRLKIEKEVESKLRLKIEQEVESKLRLKIEQEKDQGSQS